MLAGFREGVSGGSRRCVVVANESEALSGVPRLGELASSSDARFLLLCRGRSGDAIRAKSQRLIPGDLLGSAGR